MKKASYHQNTSLNTGWGEVLAGKKAGGRYGLIETESQYLHSRPKLQIKLKAKFEFFHISKMGRNPGKPVTK
ncbi:hypothetical protein [Gimesia sp.]|uniref:hypothetical protein n=1 Tax=Gimesia sp. TaxID=2024833 RepID=UPI003A937732